MQDNLNILIFTIAAISGDLGLNTWENLISSYKPANIANICVREGNINTDICKNYFIISENRVIKRLFNKKIKTGYKITKSVMPSHKDLNETSERYKRYKKKRRASLLLAREFIWKIGKWRTKELDKFLDDFKPDVILHSMTGYIHLNRIVEYAIKRTGARAVGYFWDDNFTYKPFKQTGYKIYRFFQRRSLHRLAKQTDDFFAISDMTKAEADDFFGVNCKVLTKFIEKFAAVDYSNMNKPLKMLYTGNLYIGRDNTLGKIIRALEQINKDETKIILDVYATSYDTDGIQGSKYCVIHPPVNQTEVLRLQEQADIMVFMEDIDGQYANIARLSFSTKITDYLSSGKCIFAVGNIDVAPMQYFKKYNAAIIAYSEQTILEQLNNIVNDTDLIIQYANNAINCGKLNHSKDKILKTFDSVITDRSGEL